MTAGDIVNNYYILGMAGGFHVGKIKAFYETTVKQYSPHWRFNSMDKIFHKKR